MLQRSERYSEATVVWRRLLQHDPNWEHGIAHSSLAQCLVQCGEFVEAEEYFVRALALEPSFVHLGGYASFLYLHSSDIPKAFDIQLQLLQLESKLFPGERFHLYFACWAHR